jgi:uracil-DNA glycosylase family 4
MKTLRALQDEIADCTKCPRLVAWRQEAAQTKVARFAQDSYWGRAVPSFGDPEAELLLVGLAPAAHGANRTGRMFTGDRSGDFLFASMHRTGFANQASSTHREDGLQLQNAYLSAVNRCAPPANKPLPEERERCLPFLAQELTLLKNVKVILCLGAYAWDGILAIFPTRPKPRFAHAAEAKVSTYTLLGSFHPSQQNTFTGRLTPEMLDAVFLRAKALLSQK